jgi:hypothetical protein
MPVSVWFERVHAQKDPFSKRPAERKLNASHRHVSRLQ